MSLKESERGARPFRVELTISVHKLYESDAWRDLRQTLESSVARACRGEGLAHVEFDHLRALAARQLDRAICRAGIDIDRGGGIGERVEAAAQAPAFVASDSDHAEFHASGPL